MSRLLDAAIRAAHRVFKGTIKLSESVEASKDPLVLTGRSPEERIRGARKAAGNAYKSEQMICGTPAAYREARERSRGPKP